MVDFRIQLWNNIIKENIKIDIYIKLHSIFLERKVSNLILIGNTHEKSRNCIRDICSYAPGPY